MQRYAEWCDRVDNGPRTKPFTDVGETRIDPVWGVRTGVRHLDYETPDGRRWAGTVEEVT